MASITSHKVFPAKQTKSTLIVTPQGDAIGFQEAEIVAELQALLELIEEADVKNVLVDLGKERYFGSTVIACMNSFSRKAEEQGGRMALVNASADMLSVMRVMGLDGRWPSFVSRRAALKVLC